MCKGLFKFFRCEKFRDDFLRGHLYFSSLNYFRKAEKSEVPGQNDRFECSEILQPDSVKVTVGNIELNGLAGPISICDNTAVLRSNIMCFSTIGADDEKEFDSLEELKQDVLFPEKMIEYGEFAIVIPQADLFIERLRMAVLETGFGLYGRPVIYYDFSKDNISCGYPEIAFKKRSEFSYQREFRFLLTKRQPIDAPVILEVGDLSDIVQSCRSVDINGMLNVKYSL